MNENKEAAKILMTHYFRLLARKSGVEWGSDNESEISELVDCIFAEIAQNARRIDAIEAKLNPNA